MGKTDSSRGVPDTGSTNPSTAVRRAEGAPAVITRRDLRRAERAFTAETRHHPKAGPLRSLATVGAVLALMAGIAIPAYAATTGTAEPADASSYETATENAQTLEVSADVEGGELQVSQYSATTPEEIEEKKAAEAAAKRAKEAAAATATTAATPADTTAVAPVISGEFANPLPSGSYSLGTPSVHGFGACRSGGSCPHQGQDMLASSGTPIMAAIDGTVGTAGWSGGFGNLVTVEGTVDGSSVTIKNGHMSSIAVSAGQAVKKGDVIGYVGSTGFSDINHLHVEVWVGGSVYDPRSYLPIG